MACYETLWTRETPNFLVTLEWTHDYDDPTSYMEEADAAEVRAKLESGEWTCCDFRVLVIEKATGARLGADYLGGSVYADPSDFAKGRAGSYFPDMVRNAIAGARAATRHKLRAA